MVAKGIDKSKETWYTSLSEREDEANRTDAPDLDEDPQEERKRAGAQPGETAVEAERRTGEDTKPVQPPPVAGEFIRPDEAPAGAKLEEDTMDRTNLLISDGYVGSMGVSYHTPTEAELEEAIMGAMEIEGKSREEIVTLLEDGRAVRWCQSPNYYYDHSYGKLGRRRGAAPVTMVQCDCGHSVPQGQRMNASLGSSCPDCYDRMSG